MNQLITAKEELKVMCSIDKHVNLVNLLGICIDVIEHEVFLLIEYCNFGDLKQFLCENRTLFWNKMSKTDKEEPTHDLDPTLLLIWSYEIAKGMEYLASKNIMHGDLAARNILIDGDYGAKISDFGLSKEISSDAGT